MNTKLALAALSLALLTACGDGSSSGGDADAQDSPSVQVAQSAASPSVSESAEPAAHAFEGTWLSDPISREDVVETLEAAGMPEMAAEFLTVFESDGVSIPPDGGTGEGVLVSLELEAGQWTALISTDGTTFETLDTGGTYVANGPDTMGYTNLGAQVTTLGWAVQDEALVLEWVSGNRVEYKTVTEEVMQRVLYTSEPFRAQES